MPIHYRLVYGSDTVLTPMDDEDRVMENINYQCICGSQEFNVFTRQAYNTSVKCTKCGLVDSVHDG